MPPSAAKPDEEGIPFHVVLEFMGLIPSVWAPFLSTPVHLTLTFIVDMDRTVHYKPDRHLFAFDYTRGGNEFRDFDLEPLPGYSLTPERAAQQMRALATFWGL